MSRTQPRVLKTSITVAPNLSDPSVSVLSLVPDSECPIVSVDTIEEPATAFDIVPDDAERLKNQLPCELSALPVNCPRIVRTRPSLKSRRRRERRKALKLRLAQEASKATPEEQKQFLVKSTDLTRQRLVKKAHKLQAKAAESFQKAIEHGKTASLKQAQKIENSGLKTKAWTVAPPERLLQREEQAKARRMAKAAVKALERSVQTTFAIHEIDVGAGLISRLVHVSSFP